MNIKLELLCRGCSAPLDESCVFLGGGKITILSTLCQKCLDKQKAESFKAGRDRGVEVERGWRDKVRMELDKVLKSVANK